jgi:hypothetical protein
MSDDYKRMDMPKDEEGQIDFNTLAAALMVSAVTHTGPAKILGYESRLEGPDQDLLLVKIAPGLITFPKEHMGNRFAASLFMATERLSSVRLKSVSIEDEEE